MSNITPPSVTVEIFQNGFNSINTDLFVRVPDYAWEEGWRLSGSIEGPHCQRSETLPAIIALIDQGRGDSLLAAARVPDPCAWSADLPATYRVNTTLSCHGKTEQEASHFFSFRANGIRQTSFFQTDLNGNYQRWVLRSADQPLREILDDGGQQCRTAGLCCVVINPTTAQCNHATREGLWMLAMVDRPTPLDAAQKVAELDRWPCVAGCVVHADLPFRPPSSPGIHLPLGCWLAEPENEVPNWAEFCMADAASTSVFNQAFAKQPKPVIAAVEIQYNNTVQARAACADLQKQLAPAGDYAGYTVFNKGLPF